MKKLFFILVLALLGCNKPKEAECTVTIKDNSSIQWKKIYVYFDSGEIVYINPIEIKAGVEIDRTSENLEIYYTDINGNDHKQKFYNVGCGDKLFYY